MALFSGQFAILSLWGSLEESEDNYYILCRRLALSCKKYGSWDRMFLELKDLVSMNELLNLMTNRLRLLTQPWQLVKSRRESFRSRLDLDEGLLESPLTLPITTIIVTTTTATPTSW